MGSIWAVAKNTIRQALRLKIAAVFILTLLVLLPLMAMTITGDGTLKGRLQTFVSYGLSLTSLLLSLLTIIVSVYSLTNDLDKKQIYTVLTKPIRRFQLLLGKLLGVILLDVALLSLFAGIIYAIMVNIPAYSNADPDQKQQAQKEFFTARAALTPAEPDVTDEVRKIYEKREKRAELPPEVIKKKTGRENYLRALTKQVKAWKRAVVPGRQLFWKFDNVQPLDPNESIFIRYKYDVSVNPPDLQVYGKWFVGDDRQYGGEIVTPIYALERKDLIRTSHEIEVPAKAVAKDGYLAVGFFNDPQFNNTIVIFPPNEGLQVLYKADTFTANFLRSALLILCRLIFLACLGTLAATFLSFPIAILLCLAVFFTGTINGFIIESFDYISKNIGEIYTYTVKPLMQLLPQFDKVNPSRFLIPGRLLSWSFLAKIAGTMLCIKAFLILLIALLVFRYKEIAKITI